MPISKSRSLEKDQSMVLVSKSRLKKVLSRVPMCRFQKVHSADFKKSFFKKKTCPECRCADFKKSIVPISKIRSLKKDLSRVPMCQFQKVHSADFKKSFKKEKKKKSLSIVPISKRRSLEKRPAHSADFKKPFLRKRPVHSADFKKSFFKKRPVQSADVPISKSP